ncbi:MAG: polysaccharide deacetylase family protein, partial [Desulfovermiculus sp.]
MPKPTFSPAEYFGLSALLISGIFLAINPLLATIPLGIFLVACGIAPFIPGLGFFLSVISRGPSSSHAVALTFDDGPDPQATPDLLALLQEYDVPATF